MNYKNTNWSLEKLGLPRKLAWGFLAIFLFMTGDGIETNYLSVYLTDLGLTQQKSAIVIAYYGITAAIGAVLAGTISSWKGPRAAMMWGAGIWIIFEVLFLIVAVPSESFELIALTYTLRGFGYPLFAFGFLVWINTTVELTKRTTAAGWFWFAFTAGFPTVGSLVASAGVDTLGKYATLWLSLGVVVLGTLVAYFGITETRGRSGFSQDGAGPLKQLARSLSAVVTFPKVGMAVVLRVIATAPQIASFVYMPFFFVDVIKLSISEYLTMTFVMYAVCTVACLFIGRFSDDFGWRKTMVYIGGIGCALTTLAMYYGALQVGPNLLLCTLICCCYGFTLTGFIPLTTVMSTLRDAKGNDDGTILALYALGAGVSAFMGPAIVGALMPAIGVEGLVWTFAGMYLAGAVIALLLKTEADPGEKTYREAQCETVAS
ncbi:MFS transporter [Pseudomonas sp. NPDC089752]|uniref:MFS transporter n=1 Tax=Pseudomonas sp. NPDC089752 TaxID=3364472 RepID=UPI003822242D